MVKRRSCRPTKPVVEVRVLLGARAVSSTGERLVHTQVMEVRPLHGLLRANRMARRLVVSQSVAGSTPVTLPASLAERTMAPGCKPGSKRRGGSNPSAGTQALVAQWIAHPVPDRRVARSNRAEGTGRPYLNGQSGGLLSRHVRVRVPPGAPWHESRWWWEAACKAVSSRVRIPVVPLGAHAADI